MLTESTRPGYSLRKPETVRLTDELGDDQTPDGLGSSAQTSNGGHGDIIRPVALAQPGRRVPAYYFSRLADFALERSDTVLGILTAATGGSLDATQRDAWIEEIEILKTSTSGVAGSLYLEFDIPRLGSRVDAIVLTGAAVIPIEFKCGDRLFSAQGYNQAWDYGLDLKNFHEASHDATIFPILVATKAPHGDVGWDSPGDDGVWPPRRSNAAGLHLAIRDTAVLASGHVIDANNWGLAAYRPTPTIIEAARALYSRHSVEAITRNDAGAQNLSVTSGAIEEVIENVRDSHSKAIVFVTGVPGAGKTLVGLDVATRRRELGDARAVFLSGNGPLVAVLREALTRDEAAPSRHDDAQRSGSANGKAVYPEHSSLSR